MSTFPLNIPDKQDHPDTLSSVQGVDPSFYVKASEFNRLRDAISENNQLINKQAQAVVLQFQTLANATSYYNSNSPDDYTRFDIREDGLNNGEYVFLSTSPNNYRFENSFIEKKVFNNISQLKATNQISNNVLVLGFSSLNDGGGGEFFWDESSTDTEVNGLVIEVDGLATGRYKRIFKDGILDVRFTGCRCDNTGLSYNGTATDDTANLLIALGYAANNNLKLFQSKDSNMYLAGIVDLSGDFSANTIEFNGRIVGDNNGDNSKIIVGTRDSITVPCNFTFNEMWDTDLQVQGVKNARVKLNRGNRLIIYSDGDIANISSSAYNRFELGTVDTVIIENNENAIGNTAAWNNENDFYCGRLTNVIIRGTYAHNNNAFYGATFENGSITITNGSSNKFLNTRMEGICDVTFGANTRNNFIEHGWANVARDQLIGTSMVNLISDEGINNIISLFSDRLLKDTIVYEASKYSENYNLSTFKRNGTNLDLDANFTNAYITDLIALDQDFGVIIDSDADAFRCYISVYDVNGDLFPNPTTDPEVVDGVGFTWEDDLSRYITSTNQEVIKLAAYKSDTVKFISLRVITGSSVTSLTMNRLRVTVKSQYPFVDNSLIPNKLISSSIPTSTDYPEGTKVYKEPLAAGGNEGWVYLGSTWKTFGAIEA